MSIKYKTLLRKNIILDSGLVMELDDKTIIPFQNMKIYAGADPDNVVLIDKQFLIDNKALFKGDKGDALDVSGLTPDQIITGVQATLGSKDQLKGDKGISTFPIPKYVGDPTATFYGQFSSKSKYDEFLAIGSDVTGDLFIREKIKYIYLPQINRFESNCFRFCELQAMDIEDATIIEDNAFGGNHLTEVNLPNVITIENNAFDGNPLTKILIPKAATIEDNAFLGTINFATTGVTMLTKFNTSPEKDRIFGANNWNNITFTWV